MICRKFHMYLKDVGNFLSYLGGSSPPPPMGWGVEGEGGDSSANKENIFSYRTDFTSQERKPSQLYSASPNSPQFQIRCLSPLFTPLRLERDGPCWLLKLRWMGTQRVQMKGVLPRSVWSALAALVGPALNIFFLAVPMYNMLYWNFAYHCLYACSRLFMTKKTFFY